MNGQQIQSNIFLETNMSKCLADEGIGTCHKVFMGFYIGSSSRFSLICQSFHLQSSTPSSTGFNVASPKSDSFELLKVDMQFFQSIPLSDTTGYICVWDNVERIDFFTITLRMEFAKSFRGMTTESLI